VLISDGFEDTGSPPLGVALRPFAVVVAEADFAARPDAMLKTSRRSVRPQVRLQVAPAVADPGPGQPQASAILGQSATHAPIPRPHHGPHGPCFQHRPDALLATLEALPEEEVGSKLRALAAAQPQLLYRHPDSVVASRLLSHLAALGVGRRTGGRHEVE